MRILIGFLLLSVTVFGQSRETPMIDFSVSPHLGLLDGPHIDISDIHVGGVYWDGNKWRSHGEGARLYRFDRIDYRADGSIKTMYHGLGFCAPIDLQPGKTCGQFDQLGQEEVARIVRPLGKEITRIWLSEIVGNDTIDIGGSNSGAYDPSTVSWFTQIRAGEGNFNIGIPCEGEPTEGPRECDAIEGPVDISIAHRSWKYYWIRGVSGGRNAFVVWGVDVE